MTIKIVIPMAGFGTRMRPHTWSKPKPLISVAGKTALDHLLDSLQTVPDPMACEYVFIVAPYLGETQIPDFKQANYPDLKVHYIVQTAMRGQSDAIALAREHLHGPMLLIFSDTLIEADFSSLDREALDGVAWVKAVADPRRFGVAEVAVGGNVRRFIEKPETKENKLAVVGCYYFKQAENLLSAIEEQVRLEVTLKGEFFLVDALNIMLARGAQMRTQKVAVWLDTGTLDATLETNRYLLEHGRENAASHAGADVKIIRPVFIHPTAEVSDSTIGPHVSIGANCRIGNSKIENSILEEGVQITAAALTGSIIGRRAEVAGRGAGDRLLVLNIGDDSVIKL